MPYQDKEYGVIGSFCENGPNQTPHTCEFCGGPVWLTASSREIIRKHGDDKVAKICLICAASDQRIAGECLETDPDKIARDLNISREEARVLIDGAKDFIDPIRDRIKKRVDPTKK